MSSITKSGADDSSESSPDPRRKVRLHAYASAGSFTAFLLLGLLWLLFTAFLDNSAAAEELNYIPYLFAAAAPISFGFMVNGLIESGRPKAFLQHGKTDKVESFKAGYREHRRDQKAVSMLHIAWLGLFIIFGCLLGFFASYLIPGSIWVTVLVATPIAIGLALIIVLDRRWVGSE